jgi:peptide/nickel transport system ATP-binding protein/oligopeptide transport system ATP-binding protein
VSTAAAPLLRVEGLRVQFAVGGEIVRAVDGISFSVSGGQTLCIVGESGCGKSVTALSVMRLLPERSARVTGGSVELAGTGNLLDLPEERMREIRGDTISMIFQEPMTSLNPLFTVGGQVAEVLRVHRGLARAEAFDQAVEMLRLVGIPSPAMRARSYPHQLSGGMRQRVMIAIALACRPRLMFADEPTTALDVTIQAQILQLVERLQQEEGTAVVLITHNMGVVAEIAQRVCVMYAGVIVEEADTAELFARPLHPYTRGLLASIPRPERGQRRRERLKAIPGLVPDLRHLPRGCRFADRCSEVHAPCRESEPALVSPASTEGHRVRCWLHSSPSSS